MMPRKGTLLLPFHKKYRPFLDLVISPRKRIPLLVFCKSEVYPLALADVRDCPERRYGNLSFALSQLLTARQCFANFI